MATVGVKGLTSTTAVDRWSDEKCISWRRV